MTEGWAVIPLSLLYLGVLFLIAFFSDKFPQKRLRLQAWLYSFSIAVYCTSWTFYGTVGQAQDQFLSYIPVYLGPIIVFVFGWKLLARLVIIAKREHITTIADFIAARYGKSQTLAVVISLLCILGILPYIALQLRAIVMGLDLIGGESMRQSLGNISSAQIALMVSVLLAVFTMLFGTRHIDATEHHRGVIVAIAFESLIKLVAFVAVGCLAVSLLGDASIEQQQHVVEKISADWDGIGLSNISDLIFSTVLAMLAVICLPRQFHVTVVENNRVSDLRLARWVFPGYLLLLALFVMPISLAGQLWLPAGTPADSYVVSLPLFTNFNTLGMAAFIGGTSAASGMVVVSTIALAIMVSNDLVLPLLLRRGRLSGRNFASFSELLLNVRRTTILAILLLSWGSYLLLGEVDRLADIGVLSFAAISQLAIPLIGGLYWREGNRSGVYLGLLLGMSVWLLNLMHLTGLTAVEIGDSWLAFFLESPELFGHRVMSDSNWGILLSLSMNLAGFIIGSRLTSPAVSERLQAMSFVSNADKRGQASTLYQSKVSVEELHMLTSRFLGSQRISAAFARFSKSRGVTLAPHQQAPEDLIVETERLLAGVFGSSSSRLVLSTALQGKQVQLEEFATIAEEASELMQFNRDLLQGAIEHIDQGITIVDTELSIVSWNRRYIELFEFPAGFIYVGRPIEDVVRYNAQRGLCGPGDLEQQVQRRVSHLRRGSAHTSSREYPDGRVIQVQGNPMPGGGFVMTFSDISTFRQAERMLKQTNEILEARVEQRTHELSNINQQLLSATEAAESANQSKSRFLAAVSHDLMQPLNAAKLFTASLLDSQLSKDSDFLAQNIDKSLYSAEEIISDLLDISRLESGRIELSEERFVIGQLLRQLLAEFTPLAAQQGVRLKVVESDLTVFSDSKLLRRILQNFLTNALRYNPNGKVLLGVRREGDFIRLQVWDNGPGIETEKQQLIFNEFQQIDAMKNRNAEQGLGLGLAIAKGFSELLNAQIQVKSTVGKGSVFSVRAPITHALPLTKAKETVEVEITEGAKVMCIDNEPEILIGMESLLGRWGYEVICCEDEDMAQAVIDDGWRPELILSDYHLDNDQLGTDVVTSLKQRFSLDCGAIIISADRQAELIDSIRAQGYVYLSKPLRPLRLKTLCQQLLLRELAPTQWLSKD
ncbi:response regulator [Alginatibacterium sediminis]|uniref:histidine kinase n=1 Tax=Alginatibacterium sediminis TaxID=2164068 RepID=A0A420E7E4_9ALTE|nr:response regulator [Alginatibacterium sediminis]